MAGTTVASPVVELLGNTAQFRAEFAKAGKSLNALGAPFDRLTAKITRQFGTITDSTFTAAGALRVMAGATVAGFAAKKLFDVGAAVEETASKFRTVMGPATEDASAFLREFANTAGLTRAAGQEVLATTAAIAQGMGFAQRESAAFAEEIVRLAGDLSSFNNIPIAETSRAIQAALTGEREMMKRYGIVIRETDVQQRALTNSGKTAVDALTQQERATATLQIITERAGVAIGDLGRTMDSPANRARALVARIGDIRDSMAHGMLPAMGVVLEALGEIGGPTGFDGLSTKLTENASRIAAWTRFAVESFKTAAHAIALPIRAAFNLGQIIGDSLVLAILKTRRAFIENLNEWKALLNGFIEGLNRLPGVDIDFRFQAGSVEELTAGVDARAASMKANLADIGNAFSNVVQGFDAMRVASAAAWQTLQDGAAPAAEAVGTALQDVTAATFDTKAAVDDAKAANERMTRLLDDQREALAILRTPFDEYIEQVALLELVMSRGSISTEQFNAALQALRDATNEVSGTMADLTALTAQSFNSATAAIADFATGSKNALHNFVTAAIKDIVRLMVKLLALRALQAVVAPGSFLATALNIPARASGGPVVADRAYMVGERGPELFVPRTAGSIASNAAVRGGGDGPRVIKLQVSVPPAQDPITMAGDARWQRALRESLLVAEHQGFEFEFQTNG